MGDFSKAKVTIDLEEYNKLLEDATPDTTSILYKRLLSGIFNSFIGIEYNTIEHHPYKAIRNKHDLLDLTEQLGLDLVFSNNTISGCEIIHIKENRK